MAKWRCLVCGWICEGSQPKCPPAKCPKCGAPTSKFKQIS
ncbi:MAG: rubrerythrin family protein [Candidatus Helarchaeota archaeon]|nr:rubrerythrin family protein [Candidatus Helarchaeota archaeon]